MFLLPWFRIPIDMHHFRQSGRTNECCVLTFSSRKEDRRTVVGWVGTRRSPEWNREKNCPRRLGRHWSSSMFLKSTFLPTICVIRLFGDFWNIGTVFQVSKLVLPARSQDWRESFILQFKQRFFCKISALRMIQILIKGLLIGFYSRGTPNEIKNVVGFCMCGIS